MIGFVFNDGGRAEAGFQGTTDDCVVRSIAIATGRPYREVYDALFALAKAKGEKKPSPRHGVSRKVYEAYLRSIGWEWVPTMRVGQGCTVHLRADELPSGRIIARLSRHLCAVIDGVIYDTFDPSRRGTRCVYGYFQAKQGTIVDEG